MKHRLGLCSSYSLLYGVRKPGELAAAVKSFGAESIGICDRDNLYGVHTAIEKAKEQGLRPVIGAALTTGEGIVFCFVRDRRGFGRLCELLTLRNRNTDPKKYDLLVLLREDSRGLILVSTGAGILENLAGRVSRLYSGLTPSSLGGLSSSRKLSIPLALIDDSIFLKREDCKVHRVLRAVGLNKTVGNLTGGEAVTEGSGVLLENGEIERRLRSWPEALRGTEEIAHDCAFNELFDGFIFPGYKAGIPPGEELRQRVYEGAALRYGELGDGEIERIEYELAIIEEKGFAPYFLVMDDIVRMSPRTCGRGSGASSVVSYSLGITNVDPIRYKLYFERFLNAARSDPPDIDVDFAWDERDDLIKAVIERFGPDHCARVANHNFFRPRSALRETAKAYGFGDAEISKLERHLEVGAGDRGRENDAGYFSDTAWREVFTLAKKIEGLPRGLSMHCGGLVITPDPIRYHVPIEASLEGYPLLAWEKEGVEAAGFVKIDLLGNRSLAVIRDTLKNLEEQGVVIDRNTWRPADDTATIDALSKGNSIGVFYIESPAMRQLQIKTGAGDFDHIVIHSSIIRPAANRYINEYVRRLKGGEWEPLHPRLEKILDETYGILCYQEDVSKSAVALAGFGEVEADKLRKAIAKKAGGEKLAVYERQFYEGCRKNDISEECIKKIWDMMLSFDGYSFCKAHSASYAMVSLQSAYLRVHHPAEFMAAVMSNQGGYYRPHAYIAECRRMGLFTVGPDVNISRYKYYGRGREVVIGLMAIRGLSVSAANDLVKERERGGEFECLDDFIRRVKLDRDDIIALCPAGVFDGIAGGLSRTIQARRLLAANTGTLKKGQRELFATGIVSSFHLVSSTGITPNKKENQRTNNDLWEEYGALGYLRNVHPLALWKNEVMAVKGRVKALRIKDYIGRYVKMAGWPITQKEVWTKDGLAMSFLSLEDETAMYETVIFPKIYERYNSLLFDQRPLLVYGLVCDDMGAVSLEVRKIEALNTFRQREPV